jgi:hypothetical protein
MHEITKGRGDGIAPVLADLSPYLLIVTILVSVKTSG